MTGKPHRAFRSCQLRWHRGSNIRNCDNADSLLRTDRPLQLCGLLQAFFGGLQLSDEMAQSDPSGLAALAALQHHLTRMLASQELASSAQLVHSLLSQPAIDLCAL